MLMISHNMYLGFQSQSRFTRKEKFYSDSDDFKDLKRECNLM